MLNIEALECAESQCSSMWKVSIPQSSLACSILKMNIVYCIIKYFWIAVLNMSQIFNGFPCYTILMSILRHKSNTNLWWGTKCTRGNESIVYVSSWSKLKTELLTVSRSPCTVFFPAKVLQVRIYFIFCRLLSMYNHFSSWAGCAQYSTWLEWGTWVYWCNQNCLAHQ